MELKIFAINLPTLCFLAQIASIQRNEHSYWSVHVMWLPDVKVKPNIVFGLVLRSHHESILFMVVRYDFIRGFLAKLVWFSIPGHVVGKANLADNLLEAVFFRGIFKH